MDDALWIDCDDSYYAPHPQQHIPTESSPVHHTNYSDVSNAMNYGAQSPFLDSNMFFDDRQSYAQQTSTDASSLYQVYSASTRLHNLAEVEKDAFYLPSPSTSYGISSSSSTPYASTSSFDSPYSDQVRTVFLPDSSCLIHTP